MYILLIINFDNMFLFKSNKILKSEIFNYYHIYRKFNIKL